MDYKTKLDDFFDEMVEGHLRVLCSENEKHKQHRKKIVAMSEQVEEVLKSLPAEKRKVIDEYLEEKNIEHYDEIRFLYKQGFKDGIKFKKDFEM